MIRINLLGVERQKVRKAPAFDVGRQVTLASALILVLAAGGIGWWYWSLDEESTRVDAEIAAAQQETSRLATLLQEVKEFEAERQQLQQRVELIEQLRSGQSIPVQLLDHVSRSLPETLWLTSLDQIGLDVTMQGRATNIVALSDFVANLGTNPLLQKPIDIVDSKVETVRTGAGRSVSEMELINFTVKAQVAPPPKPKGVPADEGRGRAGRAGRAGARGRGN